jgi:tRNA (guanine37-N1)-methyltransferase
VALRIKILTIFPRIFDSFLNYGNPGRAVESKAVAIEVYDIRDFTTDKHRMVDDYPYGGGPGMVMKPEPIVAAIRACHRRNEIHVNTAQENKTVEHTNTQVILTSPRGRVFDQEMAEELILKDELIIVCGRYEGIDERVCDYVDREVSIGDYVLSGGEPAAMVIMDAIIRLIPGVMGVDSHVEEESFYDGLLEYPQYTRPRIFEGKAVPEVLLEGHHEKIKQWRKTQALAETMVRRPDLIKKRAPDSQEKELLARTYPDLLEQYNEHTGSD